MALTPLPEGFAMTADFPNRRTVLTTGLAGGAALSVASASGPRTAHAATDTGGFEGRQFGLRPQAILSKTAGPDQSAKLQKAVDAASRSGRPLILAPGRYRVSGISIPSHTTILGTPGQTMLIYGGGGQMIDIRGANHVRLDGVILNGANRPLDTTKADALLSIEQSYNLHLVNISVTNSLLNGMTLRRAQATITDCTVTDCGNTGIFSLDARDTRISHNIVDRCGNNGIQVWRSSEGEDGTMVNNNLVRNIQSRAGGDGQNGNGINVYRAGAVQVNNNRITDCAFTAIRGNAASNVQMVGNHCLRLGEVALYAEFGFEGALIANNLIDTAATGISVTNFNDGGRLAVVQGNLIRNLTLRKHTIDTRGIGIGVEADTAVVGNVIENAPAVGIAIGWGRYMRDVSATSNIVRQARIGIGISGVKGAGPVFVTNNMLSATTDGAIRMMDHNDPKGPDLARADAGTQTNFTVFGNVSA